MEQPWTDDADPPLGRLDQSRRRRSVLRANALLNGCWLIPTCVLVVVVARLFLQLSSSLDDSLVAGQAQPGRTVRLAVGLPVAAASLAGAVGWFAGRAAAVRLARSPTLETSSAWVVGGLASLLAGVVAVATLLVLCML